MRALYLPTLLSALALLLLAGPCAAFAAGPERGYGAQAVQNRQYFGHHELNLSVGVLPVDAFTKGVTLSGSYTLHFDEAFGWEIVQLTHSFPIDSGLKDDLAAFDLQPTPFEVLETFITSSFVFKPIYWKGAILDDTLVRGEMMLLFGAGYGWYTRSTRPGFDAGLAVRLFFSQLVSMRLDVRYLAFLTIEADDALDAANELWIGLSLGFTL